MDDGGGSGWETTDRRGSRGQGRARVSAGVAVLQQKWGFSSSATWTGAMQGFSMAFPNASTTARLLELA